ncbi:hypothetical protein Agub_g136, partial [Astrephomene gubernaculifera]
MDHIKHIYLLFTLYALVVGSNASSKPHYGSRATAEAKAALLQSCYNKHYNGTPSTFEDFLRGFNTSLYLHQVFWSKKQSQLPLTIFVGATLERLGMLEAQCRSYPGPLSAAIYVPLLQQTPGPQLTPANQELLQQATASVKQLFDSLESNPQPPSCSLTALLLFELSSDPALLTLLPINSLRNAALLAAGGSGGDDDVDDDGASEAAASTAAGGAR